MTNCKTRLIIKTPKRKLKNGKFPKIDLVTNWTQITFENCRNCQIGKYFKNQKFSVEKKKK